MKKRKKIFGGVEDSAKINAEYFELLFDFAPAGFYILDNNAIILGINNSGATILCKERHKLKDHSFLQFISSDTLQVFQHFIHEVFNSNTRQICEVKLSDKSDKAKYIYLEGIILVENNRCLVTAIDITDLKRIENALKDSEEKFKFLNDLTNEMLNIQELNDIYQFIATSLQKSFPDSIVFYISIKEKENEVKFETVKGIENSFINKVVKLLGFNPIGKKFNLDSAYHNFLRTGKLTEFEGGITEFSATEIPAWVAKAIGKLIGLHKIYSIGIKKDEVLFASIHFFTFNRSEITDASFIEIFVKQAGIVLQKKNMEIALRESEEKFKQLIKNSFDTFGLIDSNGILTFVSDSCERYLGYKPEELLGVSVIEQMVHPLDKGRTMVAFKDIIIKGSGIFKFRHKHKNGDWIYLEATGSNQLNNPFINSIVVNVREISERINSERILIENERKYHTLLDFAPNAFFHTDSKGNLITVNNKAVELTNYSKKELLSLNISDIFNDEELMENPILYDQLIYGETIKTERKIKNKKGDEIQIEMISKIMQDGTYQCYMNDITDRKKAEEAFMESQQQYKSLTDSSPVGIFRTRPDGYTIFVNKRWCELSGLSFNEALGYGWLKSVHPEDRQMLARNWENDVKKKQNSVADYRFLKPDGSIVWVVGSAVPEIKNKKIIGFVGTITDITERKQSEKIQTLLFNISQAANYAQSIEEFYNTLLVNLKKVVNTNNLYIALYDKAENIISFPFYKDEKDSPPASRKFGNGLTEYVIRSRTPLLVDEKRLKEMYYNGECEQILTIPKSWLGVPLKLKDEITGMMAIQSYQEDVKFGEIEKDILTYCSEQVAQVLKQKLNEELKHNIELAEKTSQIKQQFLANMSHEMRTPMNGILGMVDFLLQTKLDENQLDYAKTIKNSSETLLNLINDILDLSKIEAGTMKLVPYKFNIHILLKDIINLFKASIEQKGLQVSCSFDDDVPPYIVADQNRLNQIINNLISNAIKFTDRGSIDILLSKCAVSEYKSPEKEKNVDGNTIKIKVEVKDTGIGINPENQSGLFTLFGQVDSTNTRNYEGTGLGLAISKNLAEMMGGEIGVISDYGKGSTFWFTFEATPVVGASIRKISKLATHHQHYNFNIKVMLVEDKLINQKVVKLMLQNVGCYTSIANNGAEALKMFEDEHFDIVLMDIQMPVMDGVTAVKELQKKYSKLPPIIGLSANAMEGDAEKYIAAGMDDYLSKPVSAEQLYEKIAKWVNNKK